MDENIKILIIALMVGSFVVVLPWIYGILLPLILPRLSKKKTTYLYAFTTGFFLILAILGFYGEAREQSFKYFSELFEGNNTLSLIVGGITLGSIALITFALVIGIKYLYVKKTTAKSIGSRDDAIHTHNHDPHIFNMKDTNPASKAFALFLLLAHRIPGGLITGFLVSAVANSDDNLSGFSATKIVFLVTFVLHIIPEELILYYRQIEIGIPKWKAARNSALATGILVPFILVGAYTSNIFSNDPLFTIIVSTIVGSLFIFTSIVEFIPEFLHEKIDYKTWYIILACFFSGVVVSLTIFAIHVHSDIESSKQIMGSSQILNPKLINYIRK